MKGVFVIRTPDPDATERVGRALAEQLEAGTCVQLHGDLGAGKTCLIRGLAAGLGCDPLEVSSPTFTLMHRHRGSLADLVHIDAYRLRSHEELRDAGHDSRDPTAITAVEWPTRCLEALPDGCVHVRIEVLSESEREIRVEVPSGTLAERLAAAGTEALSVVRFAGGALRRRLAVLQQPVPRGGSRPLAGRPSHDQPST